MSLKNPLNKNHKGKHFTYYNNNDQPTLARISQLVYFIFFYILKFFYFLFLHGRIIQFLIMVVKMSIKSKKKQKNVESIDLKTSMWELLYVILRKLTNEPIDRITETRFKCRAAEKKSGKLATLENLFIIFVC